ncbi:MAG: hypothetical protein QW102_03250, partial [Candidatus Nezhaarchaeales archaeon]
FNAMIVVPREVRNLEKYVLGKARVAKPVGRWFNNIKLGDLVDIVKHSVSYLLEEAEVKQEVDEVKKRISEFTKTASNLQGSGELRGKIAEVLYKLYGFEVAEARDAEVMFGQAALSILLSSILYERVRHFHSLKPLMDYVKQYGPINGLRDAFNSLLKVDYEPALTFTVEILDKLPPHLSLQVSNIVNLALRISEMTSLLARDFAGRVYHEIAGDIAVRKGFATFYTEIPAAYMLSNLAIKALLDVSDIKKLDKDQANAVINALCKLKVADFACGSGTLLTATLYNASRLARNVCFLHDLECSCREIEGDKESSASIEKTLVERGIYGLDALRYATQVTALNLALMVPEGITRENITAVYIGVLPNMNAWLGSLELLDNVKTFGGLLRWIESGLKGAVETISTTRVVSGNVELLDKYDIVIMNPPFTRATGRVSKEFEEERKGLFGFIADEKNRKILKERYDEIRERVRSDLVKIAREFMEKEPVLQFYRALLQELGKKKEESDTSLEQYLSIGQAGEGLLFLYLAYRYVRPGGVIAFVLPRNLLSGISWFLVRMLLVSKFHLRYVIVSSDAEKGYNFSENTSLSECLIVAKRTDEHRPDEDTVFINLLRKPKSGLEAILLSEDTLRVSNNKKEGLVELSSGATYVVQLVPRRTLLENIDNWNRFVFLPEPEVVDIGLSVLKGDLGVMDIRVPVARLNELITSMGIDAHQFHDNFSRTDSVTPYPIVYGGGEEVREKMLVKPNAYATCKTVGFAGRARKIYEKYAGRVLLPDRIWLDTAHVIALFSETPVLSNIFYAVRLKKPEVEAEKALVYWLNTTWGLLSVVASREETRGRWMRLKTAQWRMLPVLDVNKLDDETLKRLSNAFNTLCCAKPRRIVEQFSTDPEKVDPVRLRFDLEFLKALKPDIDENEAKKKLYEIYKRIAVALKQWTKEINKDAQQ